MNENRKLRCAVYTRKSSEEGLDQTFNSLDAQREACVAYIGSQASLGWRLVPEHYDDGGISGGTLERAGIQRLLQHVRDGMIDVIVVYKIDRLTRSLMDFAKLVEVFDTQSVSFVSVTQQFNTTTSMGRLTLNVLLSFAQFEREVTAERIRDKIAASKQKGIWMGGRIPLGYRLEDRKLLIDENGADHVRYLFDRYLELRSISALAREINTRSSADEDENGNEVDVGQGDKQTTFRSMSHGHLRYVLSNPLYIGQLRHRDKIHVGQHDPIIDASTFERVQKLLATKAPTGPSRSGSPLANLLAGLIFDETGDRLSPSYAYNHGKRYRYYISHRLLKNPDNNGQGWRIAAAELERIAVQQALKILRDRPKIAQWIGSHATTDQIDRGLHAASELDRMLSAEPAVESHKQILHAMFRSIKLSPENITFVVRKRLLVHRFILGVDDTPDEQGSGIGHDSDEDLFVVDRPMVIKRRGVEARIVINGASERKPDPSLVDLIARAHFYLNRLTDGSAASINELADQISVHRADISRILPLAFLSPAITEAILTGRQPEDLTARTLSRLIEVPADWSEQAKAFDILNVKIRTLFP